jgi:hypothetical protein
MTPGTKNFTSNLRSATHHSAVLNSTLHSQHSIHGVGDGPGTVVTEIKCGTPDPEDVPRCSQEAKGVLGKLAGRFSRTGHREGERHGRGESRSEPGEFEMVEGVGSGSGSGSGSHHGTGESGIRVSYNVWRTVEEA